MEQRHLIKIRYNALVHTETTETHEFTNHDEIVVSVDDCKYGVWGKQIHNQLANKCKISNKTKDCCKKIITFGHVYH